MSPVSRLLELLGDATDDDGSWYAKRRVEAAGLFATSVLPTERSEEFRYGRIDELDLDRFAEPAGDQKAAGFDPAPLVAALEDGAIVLSLDDPRRPLTDGDLPVGLSIRRLSELETEPDGFGDLLSRTNEPFGLLATAAAADGVVIEVDRGAKIERPVVLLHLLSPSSGARVAAVRTFVHVGEAAEVNVVEYFSSGDEPLLVLPVTELELERAARVSYCAIQRLGASAWQLGYQLSRVRRDASLTSFSAALGGDYARLYTRSDLAEENAESRLLATYLASGRQVQDLRTFQDHSAARTRSDLVFKGAVADQARSVYTGMIHIAKGARRSDAAQSNRNLVLSEGAHADSVPNLDIEENDVRCSHASAVGPIDPEQHFYLESRGLPPEVADRLILLGFFDDLLRQAPDAGCAKYLREVFAHELDEVAP